MKFNKMVVTYTEQFLDWQLGDEHEINPIRSLVFTEKLKTLIESGMCEVDTDWGQASEIERMKWEAAMRSIQPEKTAARKATAPPEVWNSEVFMFGATYYLCDRLLKDRAFNDTSGIYFNPAGGEMSGQHADVDVVNDLAWACLRMADAGMNVVYVDWDAHHCYETETLLRKSDVKTFSVHEKISAASTYSDLEGDGFVNLGMEEGAGDYGLINAVAEIIDMLEQHAGKVDVIVLNAGADGIEVDPTSGLQWTINGYGVAAKMLGEYAVSMDASILVGGGGSTLPLDSGPEIWGAVTTTLLIEMLMINDYFKPSSSM